MRLQQVALKFNLRFSQVIPLLMTGCTRFVYRATKVLSRQEEPSDMSADYIYLELYFPVGDYKIIRQVR